MSDIVLSVGLQTAVTDDLQKDLTALLANIEAKKPTIKVDIELSDASKSSIQASINQLTKATGSSGSVSVNTSGVTKLAAGTKECNEALTQCNTLLEKLQTKMSSFQGSLGDTQAFSGLNSQTEALQTLITKLKDGQMTADEFAQSFSSIKAASSGYVAELQQQAEALKQTSASQKEVIASEQKRQSLLKQTTDLLTRVQAAEKNWTAAQNGQTSTSYAQLQGQVEALQKLQSALSSPSVDIGKAEQELKALNSSFTTVSSAIKDAGENTQTFGQRIGTLASKFTSWLSVSQLIMFAISNMKKMVTTVIELDTAMTELKKVTDETDATYDRFLDNAVTRAKQVGASVTDVVNASADFARLGYDIDDAAALADTAIVYKNVADGLSDISEASDSIISTMQAFGIAADDAMTIVDKFNNVSNNFAISSAGIGEAMQKSAAALNAAGNSIDESIALVTAANTVVQNPETVGTSLKTVSMYLRAAKTEAEEAGESTDGMADSVSELRDELLALTGQQVDIQLDEDTFKSTYQILKELSEVWGSLSDISQANITELIGGKRNANVISALLENFDVAESVLSTSLDSEGSALAENEKYLDSIAGKIDKFTASFEALSSTVISSDFIGGLVDGATVLLDIVEAIFDTTGMIIPLLGGTAMTAFFKNLNSLQNLGKIKEAFSIYSSVSGGSTDDIALDGVKEALKALSSGVSLDEAINGLSGLGAQGEKLSSILVDMGYDEEQVVVAMKALNNTSKSSTGLLSKMGTAFSGLAAKIGVSTTALAVFTAGLAAAAAVYVGVNLYNEWLEEVVENTREAADAWSESSVALDSQVEEITSLKTALQDGTLTEEEAYEAKSNLYSIQQSLIETYGDEAAGIDLVNGELEEQLALLEQMSAQEASRLLNENVKGFEEIVEEMTKSRTLTLGTVYGETSLMDEIQAIADKYSDIGIMDVSSGQFGEPSVYEIKFTGDATQAEETINNFMNDVRDLDSEVGGSNILDGILTTSSSRLSDMTDILSDNQESYNEYLQAMLQADKSLYSVGDKEQTAIKWVNEYAEAISNYNEALALGDEDSISDAKAEFDSVSASIDTLVNGEMAQYSQQIQEVTGQLNTAAVAQHDFAEELKGDELGQFIDEIQSLELDDIDLMAMLNTEGLQDGEEAFRELIDAAIEAGVISDDTTSEVQTLVNLLVKLGYTASAAVSDAAESVENIAQSYETLQAAVEAATTSQLALGSFIANNTYITEDTYEAIVELAGSESALSDIVDTTNGYLVTNAEALSDLVSASKEATRQNIKLASSNQKLNYHNLVSELKDVTDGVESYDEATKNTVDSILSAIDQVESEIAKYAMLEQQLLGCADAFTALEEAQEIDSAADYTDDLSSMIESLISSYENHEFGTEAFWEGFEALVPQNVYEQYEDIGEQIDAGWNYLQDKLARYFTYDDGSISIDYDNVLAFVEDGLATAFGDSTVFTGAIENFDLNPQITSLKEFADAMGLSEAAAFALGNAISKYTLDNEDFLTNLLPEGLETDIYKADQAMESLLETKDAYIRSGNVGTEEWDELCASILEADKSYAELQERARENLQVNLEIDSEIATVQAEVDELHDTLAAMDSDDPEFEVEFANYTEAETRLAELMLEKEELGEPTELTLQLAMEGVEADIEAVKQELAGIEGFDATANVYVGTDEADAAKVEELLAQLESLEGEQAQIQIYAGIDDQDVMSSLTSIEDFNIEDKDFSVIAKDEATSVLQSIINKIAQVQSKSITVTTTHIEKYSDASEAMGTARATGTAHERGNWATKSREKRALVGELGEELVVLRSHRTQRCVCKTLSNCWDILKAIRRQHKDEIYLSATVAKAEKIDCMRYGVSLSLG